MKKFNTLAFVAFMFLVLIGTSGWIKVRAQDSISITIIADCRDFANITAVPGTPDSAANAHNASQYTSYDPSVLYLTGHWTPGPTPGDLNWTFFTMDSIAPNIFRKTFNYGIDYFAGNETDDPDLLLNCPGWYFAPTDDWSTQEYVPGPCNVAWDIQRIFVINLDDPDTIVAFKYGVCEPEPLNDLGIPEYSGIDEVKDQGLLVYPNPSNGLIIAELSSFASVATIEVFNISGKLVNKIDNATGKVMINMTGMPSSIYLVRISDGVNTINRKIVLNP
jgi:hypothetical protein